MKSLEKSIADWKRKCSDLQSELDGLGGDARSAAAEAFRYKSEIEEREDQIEALRREIRALRKSLSYPCFRTVPPKLPKIPILLLLTAQAL